MARKRNGWVSALGVLAGVILFLFGSGLDLTVVGLPAGLTADVLGVVIIALSLGYGSSKGG